MTLLLLIKDLNIDITTILCHKCFDASSFEIQPRFTFHISHIWHIHVSHNTIKLKVRWVKKKK